MATLICGHGLIKKTMENKLITWGKDDLDNLSKKASVATDRKQVDINDIVINHFISIRSEGDQSQKALYLHPSYDYEIQTDNQNKKILVIYEK